MPDDRFYTPINTCGFEGCLNVPKWVVSYFSDRDGELFDAQEEWTIVCNKHKHTAFS